MILDLALDFALAAVALMVSEFDAVQRDQVDQWFGPRLPILALSVLVLAAGLAADVRAGIAAAERAIDGGDAARTLERLRAASRR